MDQNHNAYAPLGGWAADGSFATSEVGPYVDSSTHLESFPSSTLTTSGYTEPVPAQQSSSIPAPLNFVGSIHGSVAQFPSPFQINVPTSQGLELADREAQAQREETRNTRRFGACIRCKLLKKRVLSPIPSDCNFAHSPNSAQNKEVATAVRALT